MKPVMKPASTEGFQDVNGMTVKIPFVMNWFECLCSCENHHYEVA